MELFKVVPWALLSTDCFFFSFCFRHSLKALACKAIIAATLVAREHLCAPLGFFSTHHTMVGHGSDNPEALWPWKPTHVWMLLCLNMTPGEETERKGQDRIVLGDTSRVGDVTAEKKHVAVVFGDHNNETGGSWQAACLGHSWVHWW